MKVIEAYYVAWYSIVYYFVKVVALKRTVGALY